jgi:diguanylate cyclase (GGDEF)-like protein
MNALLTAPTLTLEQVVASKRILSLPEVAVQLLKIAQQRDPDFDQIIRIVKADPAISAKILKTVNSPLFGLRHRIESIEAALPRLGLTMLKTIVLGFHLARHQEDPIELKPLLRLHWRSSMTQAVFAELIGKKMAGGQPDNYFLAAMLQDIGILAMMAEAPREYQHNVLARANFPEVVTAEKSYFGFSHIEVGCAILEKWNVMECFGDALYHHHDRIVPSERTRNLKLAYTLQAASMGTEMLFSDRRSHLTLDTALKQWVDFLYSRLEIEPKLALEIIAEVRDRVTENCNIFSFDIGNEVCPDRVIEEATELLQEVMLNHQIEESNRAKRRTVNVEQDLLYRDSLCGLFNRRYMNDCLGDSFRQASESEQPIAAVFIDVDKFKSINDQFGHATGDNAIQEVAEFIKRSIRQQDIAIRFGGDEFIVVFFKVIEKDFESIVKRMSSSKVSLTVEEGSTIELGLSVGGIFIMPQENDVPNPNWIIDQADQAMYVAKRGGGGQHRILRFNGTKLAQAADAPVGHALQSI